MKLVSAYNPTNESHDAMATVFLYPMDKEFKHPDS
jgi:hypothetical protein